MMYYTFYQSPFCDLVLVGDRKKLYRVHFNVEGSSTPISIDPNWVEDDSVFTDVKRQLDLYFQGKQSVIDIPFDLVGTPFQKKVWEVLRCIPYGQVMTYKQVAEQLGDGRKARAVGMACNRNPLPLIIPCHRVVGSNYHLTGFAGGLDLKAHLLRLEGVQL